MNIPSQEIQIEMSEWWFNWIKKNYWEQEYIVYWVDEKILYREKLTLNTFILLLLLIQQLCMWLANEWTSEYYVCVCVWLLTCVTESLACIGLFVYFILSTHIYGSSTHFTLLLFIQIDSVNHWNKKYI